MARNVIWLVRVGFMGTLLLFSFIEMALGAAYIAKFDDLGFSAPDFAGLAIAISVITLLVVAPMLVIDLLRRGAITSWIIVELPVLGVLMILWLATAATTADFTNGVSVDCGGLRGDSERICRTYQAIEAFAFINWLLILFYFGALLAFSVIAQTRKNPPWRSTVRDTDFFAKSSAAPGIPMAQPWPQQPQPSRFRKRESLGVIPGA